MNFSSVSGKKWLFKKFDSSDITKFSENYSLTEIDILIMAYKFNIPIVIINHGRKDIKSLSFNKYSKYNYYYVIFITSTINLYVVQNNLKFNITSFRSPELIEDINKSSMNNIEEYLMK